MKEQSVRKEILYTFIGRRDGVTVLCNECEEKFEKDQLKLVTHALIKHKTLRGFLRTDLYYILFNTFVWRKEYTNPQEEPILRIILRRTFGELLLAKIFKFCEKH